MLVYNILNEAKLLFYTAVLLRFSLYTTFRIINSKLDFLSMLQFRTTQKPSFQH